ncbi:MAG TPA: DNA replication and repair protein RecF [Gammaproteobacteria bacterium]|nr:DNA replication and repair protein RecF [Gammaproteobacteria bacterium]
MRLERLEVTNVRCVERAVLEPGAGLNVLAGANGAGKTALLEAIHVLGSGRSFRSGGLRELTRWGADALVVNGRVRGRAGACVIGVERGVGRAAISVGRQPVRSAAALARAVPQVVLDVGSSELIEGGPKGRRRWLDTTLFHVEPGYLELWLGYHRALRQRNAALMTEGPSGGTAFDGLLVRQAEALNAQRQRIFVALRDWVQGQSMALLGDSLKLSYRQGWAEDRSFSVELQSRLDEDRRVGGTLVGPHRADVALRVGERGLRHHASRGQGKLASCLLLLAQAACIEEAIGESPLMLVDDIAAELDGAARQRILQFLNESGAQVFLTTTDVGLIPAASTARKFHVEHGQLVD